MKHSNSNLRIITAVMLCLFTAALMAQNVKGRITCNGEGVSGVVVSDGYVVTQTDSAGRYSMTSEKKNACVFYTLPRGYEPQTLNGYYPKFWAKLTAKKTVSETHNFTLKKVDNDKYTLVVSTDYHLANRNKDDAQFRNNFVKRMQELKDGATTPVYNTILGDLTWDAYWTSRSYNLNNFKSTMATCKFPLITFPVIGNHDNDPSVAASDSCDFESSAPWRTLMAPRYYSYNLGKIHFVVLDNIIYINKKTKDSYGEGIAGDRNYTCALTDEQLEWLKKDLEYVDKNSTVIVELHAPTYRLNKSTFETVENSTSAKALSDILAPYKEVHYISGHTHFNQNMHPTDYPNITEHNIAAVCAQWWWTGALAGVSVCSDGTPGGYSLWEISGDTIAMMQYMSDSDNEGNQFRVYDMNVVSEYYANNDTIQEYLAKNTKHTNYKNYAKNVLLINVFAYDTSWKIDVYENGTKRTVVRMPSIDDPLSLIAYDIPRYRKSSSYSNDGSKNAHTFFVKCASADKPVTVKVTDNYGNVYTKTITRPGDFSLNIDATQPQVTQYARDLVGIDEVKTKPRKGDGIERIYTLDGVRQPELQKGLNIVIKADGSVKKVLVK